MSDTETRRGPGRPSNAEREAREGYVKVEDISALIAAEVAKAVAARGDVPASDDPAAMMAMFAQTLSSNLRELTDQGVGAQRKLAPEIVLARKAARDRMIDLIMEAHARGDAPEYKLTQPCYLDQVLVSPVWVDYRKRVQATQIIWPGEPNYFMIPVNDVAKAIYAAWKDSVGNRENIHEDRLKVTANGLVVTRGGTDIDEKIFAVEEDTKGAIGQGLRIRHRDAEEDMRPVAFDPLAPARAA